MHLIEMAGSGRNAINCEIKTKSVLESNKHTISFRLNSGSYSTPYRNVAPGTYYLSIPASWFNGNNNILNIKIDTYDSGGRLQSGSFIHSIPLWNSTNTSYYNYVSTFLYPTRTYPGETCTINILPPKHAHANGVMYDVAINYTGTNTHTNIATNVGTGKISFVVPDGATNSCMDIIVTTKVKTTGKTLGTVTQSVSIEKAQFDKPQIILPDNYKLTITEGVNAKIKGASENIKDYMFIYAKASCNVANAVSKYNTSSSFYAAPPAELQKALLDNTSKDVSYYILKNFDDDVTFIQQDEEDRTVFHIRTPNTNEINSFNDFYALQWFDNVEPGDLIYLYAIERQKGKMNDSETPNLITKEQVNVTNWKCDHCQLADYRWWSISSRWNPYGRLDLASFKAASLNSDSSLILTVNMNRSLNYPPKIYITHTNSNSETGAVYLTSITNGPSSSFDYVIPVSFITNQISLGRSYSYIHTHWGQNTNVSQAQYVNAYVSIMVPAIPLTGSIDTEYYTYSNISMSDITKISTSEMTPYVVIPPAVKPIELSIKNQSSSEITISYRNPLYKSDIASVPAFKQINSITFDVTKGDDKNDYSDLNTIDNTLYIEQNEKRFDTYEKRLNISSSLLESIKKASSNDIYFDVIINSVLGKNLNFVPITSHNVKMQIMLSKNNGAKTRIADFNSDMFDLKKDNYSFLKMAIKKSLFINNDFNMIHLLYNIDPYDEGKKFKTHNWKMQIGNNNYSENVGWRPLSGKFGSCTFESYTYEIADFAREYGDDYVIRLCLENLSASETLYAAPNIIVKYHKYDAATEQKTEAYMTLEAKNKGQIKVGEDIIYTIPKNLYNINVDDILVFSLTPVSPYPVTLSKIDFSDAYIEVVKAEDLDPSIDKYANGFTAKLDFYEGSNMTSSSSSNAYQTAADPVECIDVLMCCYDKNKKLINKSANKRRDIYNGKEFVYYSDRKWHSFVGDKYINNLKYKQNYDMTFTIPNNTEYMLFVSFAYSNWHDNPSIYSMSNILSANLVVQDMGLSFINPEPSVNANDNTLYANSDISNPEIKIKLSSQKSTNVAMTNNLDGGFNLASDSFDINKWLANPIVYSNNKKYGYEQPNFSVIDLYTKNNVVNSLEPLYSDIEYYSQWKNLYGKDKVVINADETKIDPVDVLSEYTIFEDEGDKFISHRSVPYIEIPPELVEYDRSKISLFLDADFGVGTVIPYTKLVTEIFTENYKLERVRDNKWGVRTLWTSNVMERLMDIAAIEDIKIEWGMKLNRDHTHPTEGRRGPILVEDLYYNVYTDYDYDPAKAFPDECTGNRIRDYGGHNIWHKNYGDYIYFEITNPRLKRLFLEWNSHRRRHDAILFEDFAYDWCWDTTIKVRYTVTKRVNEDNTPIYKRQNLPAAHYGPQTWVGGWAMYDMPKFKADNIGFIKAPTESDPSFVMTYDVYLSPVVFYYKNNPITGDELGNVYKYTWGDNPEAFMKWETITVKGTAPFVHEKTHYYIAYDRTNCVYSTFRFEINKDGSIVPR
jgi:hypothetical protein